MLNNLIEIGRRYIAERQMRQAIRAQEKWTLIKELTEFYYHNHPLLIGGSLNADIRFTQEGEMIFTQEEPQGEFTPLQLVFHELGEDAVDEVVECLVMGGFIFDPDGVHRDLKKERHKPSFVLTLNRVFDLQVSTVNDSLGKSTYITLAPYGEKFIDRLDG